MNEEPGAGWANLPPAPPPIDPPECLDPYTATQRGSNRVSLDAQAPTAQSDNNPPPDALPDEGDEPSDDPSAAESTTPSSSNNNNPGEEEDATPPGDEDAQSTADGGEEDGDESAASSVSDGDGDGGGPVGPVPTTISVEDPERATDLAQQVEHEADKRLIGVYGDTVHRNDGRHLHGGIAEDEAMCMLYDRVTSYAHPLYSPPKGAVGRQFLTTFAAELAKVRTRESNSERAMIFPALILRKESHIRKACDIRRRITRRMALWKDGKIAELAQQTVATARRSLGGSK